MPHSEKYTRLINSWKWQRLRLVKLGKNPLCEMCEKKGRTTPATQVHHIIPVESEKGMAAMYRLAYDYHNLMSVCDTCHEKIHAELRKKSQRSKAELRAARLADFRRRFID